MGRRGSKRTEDADGADGMRTGMQGMRNGSGFWPQNASRELNLVGTGVDVALILASGNRRNHVHGVGHM
jgi:hypothetical protein